MKKKIWYKVSLITIFIFADLMLAKFAFADYVSESNMVITLVGSATPPATNGGGNAVKAPDGKHACPIQEKFITYPGDYSNIGQEQYSYVCWHGDTPPRAYTHCAIDMGVYPGGGEPEHAVTSGVASRFFSLSCGHAVFLEGDDGVSYLYCHMHDWTIPDNQNGTKVIAGDVLGYAASAAETSSGNNGVAHLHIDASTVGDHFHPNVAMGPRLDQWCGNNVCNGKQASCPEGL